jgi:hypothetical protein
LNFFLIQKLSTILMKILKTNSQLLKLILAIAIASSFFISCTKTKTETVTIQKTETAPIGAAFFLNGNYNITTPLAGGASGYEYGCLFTVAKNGKILRMGAKMPTSGNYRVTLWDAVTKTQLAQVTGVQANDGVLTLSSLASPVAVVAGKTYLVSMWSASTSKIFYIQQPGGGNISFPITSGSITITGYQFSPAAQNPITYPNNPGSTSVSGLADIEFQAD